MKKQDLKVGYIVEYSNGCRRMVSRDGNLIDTGAKIWCNLENFTEDLKYIHCGDIDCKSLNIMKVYDFEHNLLWERKELPMLKEIERLILKEVPKEYKYIARDDNSNLFFFRKKPYKSSYCWLSCESHYKSITILKHLFNFIKWEDKEPYLISDLLGENN